MPDNMDIDSLTYRLKRLSMTRGRPRSSYAANNKKRDRETYENESEQSTIGKNDINKTKRQKSVGGKRKKHTKKRKIKKRKSTRKK